MLFFFQNFKDLQAYSSRDSENLAAHPQKEFSRVPSPPWPLTFTHNDIYSLKALVEVLPSILGCCVPHKVLNPDPVWGWDKNTYSCFENSLSRRRL